ncbi:hypothetical protein CVT24_007561 [Panaeolus cyanescens]|uniref:SWIM-type domain-containing protein n=1 Tax=Panaeolus cyanescens TaxID=181874 RepID=A0A409VR52_9AGAR|nr:hypothetical protein CVT24_007561 [Panaeolus cyanescens]
MSDPPQTSLSPHNSLPCILSPTPETTAHSPMTPNSNPQQFTFVIDEEAPKRVHSHTQSDTTKLKWESMSDAEVWIRQQESSSCISFSVRENRPNKKGVGSWTVKRILVCSRGAAGGQYSKYQKKHNWVRKKPNKFTACKCRLTLTVFPDRVEGLYYPNHNHPTGDENARFVSIPEATRKEIEAMLRLGIDPNKVLDHVHRKIYDEDHVDQLSSTQVSRNDFITRQDIRRIEKTIEMEIIRLSKQDGASLLRWVENLKAAGHFVLLKACNEPAPSDTTIQLDPSAFILIIQTRYQAQCWEQHGGRFGAIDARDRWGHGIPCAWMISSNATEETISFMLSSISTRFSNVVPEFFMSDKDQAQLNAIKRYFPGSTILLCWWHVLHAWQSHFSITHYPELWVLLKKWVRMSDSVEFWEAWDSIKAMAPASVVAYLETEWLPSDTLKQWSAMYRTERTIFQACDTNMLVEAWHHLLKGKFMQGKRNRRLDHLIYLLVKEVMPYFIARHHKQIHGFEGPDLEVQARRKIESLAQQIPLDDIQESEGPENTFLVRSQSNRNVFYNIDLDTYDCSCPSFPQLSLCKHIFAVQLHFSEICEPIPVSHLDITSPDTFESNGEVSTSLPLPESTITAHNSKRDLIASLSGVISKITGTPSDSLDIAAMQNFRMSIEQFSQTLTPVDDRSFIPNKKAVAPNQKSWTETAEVMGLLKVKGKRKTAHTDPYSGGERSGKRAKKDAHSAAPSASEPVLSSSQHPSSQMLIPDGAPNTQSTSNNEAQLVPINPVPQINVNTNSVHPLFPLTHSILPPSNSLHFDAHTFDMTNLSRLNALKQKQLYELCRVHGVPASGTNATIAANLHRKALGDV